MCTLGSFSLACSSSCISPRATSLSIITCTDAQKSGVYVAAMYVAGQQACTEEPACQTQSVSRHDKLFHEPHVFHERARAHTHTHTHTRTLLRCADCRKHACKCVRIWRANLNTHCYPLKCISRLHSRTFYLHTHTYTHTHIPLRCWLGWQNSSWLTWRTCLQSTPPCQTCIPAVQCKLD